MTEQQTPAAMNRVATRMNRAIRDEITGLILNRGLRSGDLLPTETELVEALGVSRNSIREALKALQALDIVEIRQDLAALDEVTKRMATRAKSGETFAEEDREFHELLYRSLNNALVTQLLRAFWDVFHRVNHRLGVTDPNPEQTVRRHRAIVTALRKHDVARAEHAMVEHFRNLDARVAQLRST